MFPIFSCYPLDASLVGAVEDMADPATTHEAMIFRPKATEANNTVQGSFVLVNHIGYMQDEGFLVVANTIFCR